jgi:hypothetical protein
MNTDSKQIIIEFNKDSDMERLAKIIEKKGGNIWDKKGRRAYFSEQAHSLVSSKVFAQPYDAYIDIDSKKLVFNVNSDDFDNEKFDSVETYKAEFINTLRG